MSESEGTTAGNMGESSCAYFGEGVVFKGSITAPEKVVVHGSVEGEIVARDLLVGPTGMITGRVSVDQANIQGKVFDHIVAKVCLSLRKTGRIEGSASYGEIEIEKGGVLSGEVSTIKSSESSDATQIPGVQTPSVQTTLPRPPHLVSRSDMPSGPPDHKTNVENNKLKAAGGQKPQLLDVKPGQE
jgi:cytoskeletal protein CcmA (bactofilin family)